jgi:hypothetical protein
MSGEWGKVQNGNYINDIILLRCNINFMAMFKMVQNAHLQIQGISKNMIIEMYIGEIKYDDADWIKHSVVSAAMALSSFSLNK